MLKYWHHAHAAIPAGMTRSNSIAWHTDSRTFAHSRWETIGAPKDQQVDMRGFDPEFIISRRHRDALQAGRCECTNSSARNMRRRLVRTRKCTVTRHVRIRRPNRSKMSIEYIATTAAPLPPRITSFKSISLRTSSGNFLSSLNHQVSTTISSSPNHFKPQSHLAPPCSLGSDQSGIHWVAVLPVHPVHQVHQDSPHHRSRPN